MPNRIRHRHQQGEVTRRRTKGPRGTELLPMVRRGVRDSRFCTVDVVDVCHGRSSACTGARGSCVGVREGGRGQTLLDTVCDREQVGPSEMLDARLSRIWTVAGQCLGDPALDGHALTGRADGLIRVRERFRHGALFMRVRRQFQYAANAIFGPWAGPRGERSIRAEFNELFICPDTTLSTRTLAADGSARRIRSRYLFVALVPSDPHEPRPHTGVRA